MTSTAADSSPTAPTARTRLRRVAYRGHYDRATLEAILDDAYVCHVAFADESGVHCIPTACWREDDHLYIHGSNGSRMLKLAAAGAQVCVTVTHLDGLVLARSAFNHSMNYRSAVIYGEFEVVPDSHKAAVLDTFVERIAPGRSREARPGDANELAATTVMRIALDEAATKIRTGGRRTTKRISACRCGRACCRCAKRTSRRSPMPRPPACPITCGAGRTRCRSARRRTKRRGGSRCVERRAFRGGMRWFWGERKSRSRRKPPRAAARLTVCARRPPLAACRPPLKSPSASVAAWPSHARRAPAARRRPAARRPRTRSCSIRPRT